MSGHFRDSVMKMSLFIDKEWDWRCKGGGGGEYDGYRLITRVTGHRTRGTGDILRVKQFL